MAPQLSSTATTAYLDEIFLSLQGEGAEVGRPHLFVRLAGCPVRCTYCDTPRSWQAQAHFSIHRPQGVERRPNPVSGEELGGQLNELALAFGVMPSSLVLSVTGGEPLEQAEFLAAWLPSWPGQVLLETAGLGAESLTPLLPHLDFLSLDWKIPSTVTQGWELLEPDACIRQWQTCDPSRRPKLWAKVVVPAGVPAQEVSEELAKMAAIQPGMEVFLQPATPVAKAARLAPDYLLNLMLSNQDCDLNLRVLPQIHPGLGLA